MLWLQVAQSCWWHFVHSTMSQSGALSKQVGHTGQPELMDTYQDLPILPTLPTKHPRRALIRKAAARNR